MSRKWTIGLVVLAAALVCATPPAAAAKRSAPHGFIGANWSFEITSASDETKDIAWDQMAANGVESQRLLFHWSAAQRSPHEPFDFSESDADVTRAVEHGIELLPVISSAPAWARRSEDHNSPPSDPDDYANYLRALVAQYGPVGSFWLHHPELPKRPIRVWQIWNEPSRNYQWTIPKGEHWAPGYGKLLRVSYTAIKQIDPEARVVLAGLPNRSWVALERLYEEGDAKGYFDVGAVHPYTRQPHGALTIVRKYRDVMREHGDGDKAIRVTELGLPAGKGRDPHDFPLNTTDEGQVKFLRQSFEDLISHRKKLHVTRVNWFTWASSYDGRNFDYSGLVSYKPGGEGESSMKARPGLKAYQQLARRYEGCAKNKRAKCVPAR